MLMEAKEGERHILSLLQALKSEESRLLLAYVMDVARVLRVPLPSHSFQIASLRALSSLKVRQGPQEQREPRTLLHVLVEQLEQRAPNVLFWAVSIVSRAQGAPKALASFLSFFPRLLERLRLMEGAIREAEAAGELHFARRLREVINQFLSECVPLAQSTSQIDHTLRFLGGTSVEDDEEAAADLRQLWIRLGDKEVSLLRPDDCLRLAKQDEARMHFFRSLDAFLQALKKAHLFALAKQEKATRQAALAVALARAEAEETSAAALYDEPLTPRTEDA